MHSVIGLRPRVRRRLEPTGWFGRKTREVLETAYAWTVDGTDLSEWVRQGQRHSDPVEPVEETIGWPTTETTPTTGSTDS